MQAPAILLESPQSLSVETLSLRPPGKDEVVVDIHSSGVSTGTERMFWTGRMPPFPGMGYPLVPGYEAVGEVVEAGAEARFRPGDFVFAPGADCYQDARGLFGGATSRLVSRGDRIVRVDSGLGDEAALLALAATARHALGGAKSPELIIGHGVLGRLLARIAVTFGGEPPVVWETAESRRAGACGYEVLSPEQDPRRDYARIVDASGDAQILDQLIGRLARGGEIVLAGFYADRVGFEFPPAFMREARLRVAAEWSPGDLLEVRDLVERGALSLQGLVTHRYQASAAPEAYRTAFDDPSCLKMLLNWRGS